MPGRALGPYVKLLIPPAEGEVAWPILGPGGRLAWPESGRRPIMRTYSVRRHDPRIGELAVDAVLHGAGIGASWGRTAGPGDTFGLWGRGVPLADEADWLLLAGDHTALPAMAYILENLQPGARGRAFIEVPSRAEEQALSTPAAVEVVWVHRLSESTPSALPERVRTTRCPSGARTLVWAGAEATIARAVRRLARHEPALRRAQVQVLNYWKRGAREGTFDYTG